MRKKHLIILIIVWTSFIVGSFLWESKAIISNNDELVLNKFQASVEQIIITRAWNASHGGVYVPVSPSTQPNPYLKDSLRDIVTVDGMKLTKINPAFMTRQIAEINKDKNDLEFHITSLNPIRPANKADEWETRSLELFEQGTPEVIELVDNDTGSQYRYMAPLITTEGCLQCHADQGYKLGDIRGGISISFPSKIYSNIIKKEIITDLILHSVFLILGLSGLFVYYRKARKYYSTLKNKNTELQKTNATKDKLFSIIAHDLQSPFNTILGYSELLITDYDSFDEDKRKEFINMIDKSSNQAFHLLKDLLLWAQSQTNNIKIAKEDLNLYEVINDSIDAYTPGADSKNISHEIKVDKNLIIFADKMAIRTVISNIFNNAIKFTPQNGNIIIAGTQKENNIVISITDNGVGIPAEKLPKLFIFEESNSTLGTEKEKGIGLGLTICRELIEKHNGKIWVESELGTGTSFHFSLPLVDNETNKHATRNP